MGSFANSALNLMLGWMRGAAQWLWRLIGSDQNGSALEWLGRHWIAVAIALCIVGMVIDFMVYLARWRPDLVWRSFIRRLSGKRGRQLADEAAVEQEALNQEEWEAEEGLSQPLTQQYEQQPYDGQQPLQQSYAQPADGKRPVRHRRSERHQGGQTQSSKAIKLLKKAGDLVFREEEEVTFQSYKPAKALPQTDESQQPGKPYIPPQWQKPGE